MPISDGAVPEATGNRRMTVTARRISAEDKRQMNNSRHNRQEDQRARDEYDRACATRTKEQMQWMERGMARLRGRLALDRLPQPSAQR
ncbi:hypothetical protein SARC_08216 [Sphaeroforma arctica JP610]|uniref:Uncharacterized protein n=1 Tax=Sphaeroforma arctica JP610 TaxID=667725 RepID=A0A0L0FRR9_9EUKA|nr:hypothetical protein SARC_08216 [Sphaeroforma arctica JP610]KNC79389.1 hypothetical protein SARC_08216 [Sphaeroforma arctica JP610]|eukprot:XP_014153291.1 hypothetical protein SARC_08216 [Sphaeroforma arctica JP610]